MNNFYEWNGSLSAEDVEDRQRTAATNFFYQYIGWKLHVEEDLEDDGPPEDAS